MASLARFAAGGIALSLSIFGPGLIRADAQPADASSGAIQDQPLPPPPNVSENRIPGFPASAQGASAAPVAPPPPLAPPAAGPSVPAPIPWIQGKQAQLTILDKIYGSASQTTAVVGTPFSVGFLTVEVVACWIRPPNLPPDAAAFLQVTDAHASRGSPPEFRGWVFQAEPALSGMSDPATDISIDGCS